MNLFKSKNTEKLFKGELVKSLDKSLRRRAKIKLMMLVSARDLKDLIVPPSNKLEKLKGDRKEQYLIRVNNQYRICFLWIDNKAQEIEFTDYH